MPQIGTVHWKEFEAFLFAQGCVFKREKGDHRVYWKAGLNRPIIVPRNKSLPPFVVLNNLRTLGVEKSSFLAYIQKAKKKK
jgi:predicted RNA binding protein YcfA (HicA-like mRNA interferase family)